MLIDASHWAVALFIALAVHIAGIMWFEPAQSDLVATQELSSERIVVRLGTGSGQLAASASLLGNPEESRALGSSTAAVDEVYSTSQPANMEDVEDAVTEVDEPQTLPRTVAVETTETLKSSDTAAIVADSEQSDAAKPLAVNTQLLPAEESVATEEVVVLAPTAASSSGVSAPGPVPPQVETQEKETVETIAAPVLEDAAGLQRSVPTLVSEQDDIDQAPAPAAKPPASPTQPAQQIAAVAVRASGVENVEEVDTAAPSATVTSQPAASVSVPPTEQIARAITLEELHDISGVSARYAGILKGWLRENMHYPRPARLAGQEGRATVRFVIDRTGKVLSIELEQSSGYAILDREAVEMIERADPFPIMPVEMAGTRLELRVPVVFDIHEESLIRQIPPIFLE